MTRSDDLALSDLNMAESIREMARFHSDARIAEEADLLLVASSDPFPVGFTNAVVPLAETVDPEQLLSVADAFFGPMGRGYTVMIRDHFALPTREGGRWRGSSRRPRTPNRIPAHRKKGPQALGTGGQFGV